MLFVGVGAKPKNALVSWRNVDFGALNEKRICPDTLKEAPVMERYPAVSDELEGIVVRLDVMPAEWQRANHENAVSRGPNRS